MTATAAAPAPPVAPAARPVNALRSAAGAVLAFLSSMRLTVVLLLLLGMLVYCGTIAQIDRGLYDVQKEYFESLFVWHDTGVSIGDRTLQVPLPGAYPMLVLLFCNILVGGIVRLRKSWRNAGILITHLGMAFLLIAGFVKLHFSYSGHVALYESRQTQSFVSFHDYELVLVRQDGEMLLERTVPEAELLAARDGPVRLHAPDLPFDVVVEHWYDHCRPLPKGPMFEAPTPVVDGVFLRPEAPMKEREQNTAGCYVTVVEHAGSAQPQGILWGAELRPFDDKRYPFTFGLGGANWALDLRRVVWDLPFGVRLDRFQKADHPGTMTPRDFSSWVTVLEQGAQRPMHIYMNHPLRKDGYTFFQTNWGPQPNPDNKLHGPPWWSVFEVARNPSDAWPETAAYVILLGLVVQFSMKLYRYLRSASFRQALS